MKVKVYWNLHKKVYSIQHNGRVIEHTRQIVLDNVVFRVQKAGREKVLRERRKNVHAYVCGEIGELGGKCGERISYNPYEGDKFVMDQEPIEKAEKVLLTSENGRAIMYLLEENI